VGFRRDFRYRVSRQGIDPGRRKFQQNVFRVCRSGDRARIQRAFRRHCSCGSVTERFLAAHAAVMFAAAPAAGGEIGGAIGKQSWTDQREAEEGRQQGCKSASHSG